MTKEEEEEDGKKIKVSLCNILVFIVFFPNGFLLPRMKKKIIIIITDMMGWIHTQHTIH